MDWVNRESPSYSGKAGKLPAMVEVMELRDRDGNVLKRYTKDAAGVLAEVVQETTPAIARVVVGTIDTELSGAPVVLQFGDIYITTGGDIPDDDDGTALGPFLEANAYLIPAESVVDNEDGTFDITFFPGANTIPLVSGDAALTFEETVEGVDAVVNLVAPRITDDGTDILIGEAESFEGLIGLTQIADNGVKIQAYVQDRTDGGHFGEVSVSSSDITATAYINADDVEITLQGANGIIELNAPIVKQSAPASTPAAQLANGQISFYLDEVGNKLKVAVKYSDGTAKTGEIVLA